MSQASPNGSPSTLLWFGLGAVGQLSQTSPTPSPSPSASASAWFGLLTNGQLSFSQTMRSPSASHPMSLSSTSPLQSLSSQSQTSTAPGWISGSSSLQSPHASPVASQPVLVQSAQVSPSASGHG